MARTQAKQKKKKRGKKEKKNKADEEKSASRVEREKDLGRGVGHHEEHHDGDVAQLGLVVPLGLSMPVPVVDG